MRKAWLAAAVLSGVPSTLHTLATGGSLLASTRAAGTLLGKPTVVRGGVAHLAISWWWTWVLTRLRVRSAVAGAAAGLAIAGLDLVVVGRRYPLIRALPAPPQLADHVAFGAVVGWFNGRPPS